MVCSLPPVWQSVTLRNVHADMWALACAIVTDCDVAGFVCRAQLSGWVGVALRSVFKKRVIWAG